MPALRVIRGDGESPWSIEGPQHFARLPHEALARLDPGPYQLLGAILFFHRPNRGDWLDETDGQLAGRIAGNPCRGSIQRWFADLEAEGWVQRVRRRGGRRIYLLFEWAGGQPPKPMHVAPALHACSAGATGAPRLRYMHVAQARHSSKKGEPEGILPSGEDSQGRPAAAPAPGGPPPPAGAVGEEDPATLAEALAGIRAKLEANASPRARAAMRRFDRERTRKVRTADGGQRDRSARPEAITASAFLDRERQARE